MGLSRGGAEFRNEPIGLIVFEAGDVFSTRPRRIWFPTRRQEVPRGAAMTEWYFVWIEGLRGPVPQKWSSDGLWGQVGRQDVIVRFALSDAEAHLPLDELARLHPIPDGR
jgi:hypothetical protein